MLSKEMWFMYERVEIDLPRTTNTVEGWHKLFQHTVGYAHPNNYKLIKSIQLKQCYSRNRKAKIDGCRAKRFKKFKNVFMSLVHKDCLKISIIKIRWTTCKVFYIILVRIYSSKIIYLLFVLFLETSRYTSISKISKQKNVNTNNKTGFFEGSFF